MAASPELYPILLKHGSIDSLLGMVVHENTDISCRYAQTFNFNLFLSLGSGGAVLRNGGVFYLFGKVL